MEKKRKLVESEEIQSTDISPISKKKKKAKKEQEECPENSLEIPNENDTSNNPSQEYKEFCVKKDKKKKKNLAQIETSDSPCKSNNELENKDGKRDKQKKSDKEKEGGANEESPTNNKYGLTENTSNNVELESNDTKEEKRKKQKKTVHNEPSNEIVENGESESNGSTRIEFESTPFIEGDGVTTPTTKKPPRNAGETKKQYKRRMKALREAGLLIDPPVVEGVKKDKRNRKTRKEKKAAQAKKNEELERFRSIVQVNYLKMWKNDQSKWKFNKNVQGKLFKHMFDTSRIPQDMFDILIEYIASSKSPNVHTELNKKCSEVVEAMEKWTSASEEEKKKLTEPSSEMYERARQVLQSLA